MHRGGVVRRDSLLLSQQIDWPPQLPKTILAHPILLKQTWNHGHHHIENGSERHCWFVLQGTRVWVRQTVFQRLQVQIYDCLPVESKEGSGFGWAARVARGAAANLSLLYREDVGAKRSEQILVTPLNTTQELAVTAHAGQLKHREWKPWNCYDKS